MKLVDSGACFVRKQLYYFNSMLLDFHMYVERRWSLNSMANRILVFVLEETFFCSGNKGRNARYLVKWKDLPYEDATWEDPNDLPEGLEGFQKFVDEYLQRK